MVAKLGQDGHDRGTKVIASAFVDLGFNVIAGPLFQTPAEAAGDGNSRWRTCARHFVARGSHKTLVPQVVEELKAAGGKNIIVVRGGVVPRQDYDKLIRAGVAAIFGPGMNVLEAARAVLDLIESRRRNRLD